MVRFAGHIEVPGGGEAAALRALLQEPEWSDQGCYGLGYVDGPLAVSQHGLGKWGPRERTETERGLCGPAAGCLSGRGGGQGGCQPAARGERPDGGQGGGSGCPDAIEDMPPITGERPAGLVEEVDAAVRPAVGEEGGEDGGGNRARRCGPASRRTMWSRARGAWVYSRGCRGGRPRWGGAARAALRRRGSVQARARAEPEWGNLRGGQVPPLRAATDWGPVQAPGRRRVLREPVDAAAAAVTPDISGGSGSTNQAESPHGPPASSEDAPASGTPRTAVRQGTRAQRRAGPNSVCRRKPRSGKRLRLGQTLEGCSVNTCGLTEKRSKRLLSAGYDILVGLETHGDEQGKGWLPEQRFFVGGAPPVNDPKSGVFVLLSKDMAQAAAPGGVTVSRKYPSRVLCVRIRADPVDLVIIAAYIPHQHRTNPSQQEVLDDLVVTARRAAGGTRVCYLVNADLNAQLPRYQPSRTSKWCVSEQGNRQGQMCLSMMDDLDLFAASTGYNAFPRRRGGGCTYSVREATKVSPVEKRVQLDYLLISAAFRSFFLHSCGHWKWCRHMRGDRTDHKAIFYRLRMKLVTGSRANGRRWAVLKRQEGQHGRYAQAYTDVSTRLRTEGPTRWRHDGGFQGHPSDRIPSKIMFGNLMRAARDEDVTTSPAASSSSQHDGDGAVDNDDNDNDETTASGDGSTAAKPSSDSDSDDNDDGSDDGSRTESCESEELDGDLPSLEQRPPEFGAVMASTRRLHTSSSNVGYAANGHIVGDDGMIYETTTTVSSPTQADAGPSSPTQADADPQSMLALHRLQASQWRTAFPAHIPRSSSTQMDCTGNMSPPRGTDPVCKPPLADHADSTSSPPDMDPVMPIAAIAAAPPPATTSSAAPANSVQAAPSGAEPLPPPPPAVLAWIQRLDSPR